MTRCKPLTERDRDAVEAFRNFLSWKATPRSPIGVPPAWYAYALGATKWCPPEGEW